MESGIAALLRDGPAAGIYFLCLDDSVARLPPECRRAVVQLSDDRGATVAAVHGPGRDIAAVVADVVSVRVCQAAAQAMAAIREESPRDGDDALPSAVRFLDLAGLEPPTPERIRSFWAGGGRSTRALLGSRLDGPFVVDLSQGPHMLIAGTTGSGKSELLQTLVASLAVANRPDAMNFVLIDYKGGAAFQGCAPLPHTVGMVTDLDEFEVERALASLRAELQRRKAILAQAGKSDIRHYWDALRAMPRADPLPRLVIVVDEFAVMAEQLPAQLKSLVNIGQQGRSLGVHLVLATQRPTGVVTADLRANINLRIALRVASPEDSRDVIETADAARIPGRGTARAEAYAWLGGGRSPQPSRPPSRPGYRAPSRSGPFQRPVCPRRRAPGGGTPGADTSAGLALAVPAAECLQPEPGTRPARPGRPAPAATPRSACIRHHRPACRAAEGPGRLRHRAGRPPAGGRGAAIRANHPAAHAGRVPAGPGPPGRRAPVRLRRSRRARRPLGAPALRRGGHLRRARSRRPAAGPAGQRADPPDSPAVRGRVRRPG